LENILILSTIGKAKRLLYQLKYLSFK